jgi:hypothetical protein
MKLKQPTLEGLIGQLEAVIRQDAHAPA